MNALEAKQITMKAMIEDSSISDFMDRVFSEIKEASEYGESEARIELPSEFYNQHLFWPCTQNDKTKVVISGLRKQGYSAKMELATLYPKLKITW